MRNNKVWHAIVLGLMLGLAPVLSLAGDKPTPEEAKKVIDFNYHGKGKGVVLAQTKVCHDIQREGDDKNECTNEITGPVKKGEAVYIWLMFMAPDGQDSQSVSVQFEQNATSRAVKKVQVPGQLRSRSWLKYTFDKAGAWKIKVATDSGASPEALGELTINVE
ncbi:MAG TPA: hypothetical protein VIU46_04595 [Gallionellaceae bacterium]